MMLSQTIILKARTINSLLISDSKVNATKTEVSVFREKVLK